MVFILLLKKFKCARKGLSFLVLNALIFFPNIINAQNFWEKLNFTGGITFRTTAVTDFYNFDIIFPDDGTKLYNYESNIQGFALNPGLLFNDAYLNIEYFPSLRYDVVRNVLGVENAKKREFIIDHNFNFGIKWKKLVYGLGMTIINAGKGYYFVNPMPIIRYNDIEFKKNSIVPGGLFEISKSDEKKLDIYEDFPILYKKIYFYYYNKKVMTYFMNNKTEFRYPTERYLNVVKQGYKDCGLNKSYLVNALNPIK